MYKELTNIFDSVLNIVLNHVEFKKFAPAKSKLSQAADFLATNSLRKYNINTRRYR